ncbi:uncharacterized protein [Apostichopus japonicus]|uniref:uncharacterized protein n=1 Tax=Stichopus japonicus TaxID=307972 RepID=UPI003AB52D56
MDLRYVCTFFFLFAVKNSYANTTIIYEGVTVISDETTSGKDGMNSTSEYPTTDDEVTSVATSDETTSGKDGMNSTSEYITTDDEVTSVLTSDETTSGKDGMNSTSENITTDDEVTSVVTSDETTSDKDGMSSTSEYITTDDEVTSVVTSDETTSGKDGMNSTSENITTDDEITSVATSDESTSGKDGMNSTSEYITTDDEITSSVTSQSMETSDTITIQTTDVVSKTTTEPSTITVVEETSDLILTTDDEMTSTSEYLTADDDVTSIVTSQPMVTSDKTTMHITDVTKTATEPSIITIVEETSDPILTTDEMASTLQFLTTDDEVTAVVTPQTIVTSDGISMQTTDVVSKSATEPSTITILEETSDPILTTDRMATTLQYLTTDDEVTSVVTSDETTSGKDGMSSTSEYITTDDEVTSVVTSDETTSGKDGMNSTSENITTDDEITSVATSDESTSGKDGMNSTSEYITTDDEITSSVTSQSMETSDTITIQTTDVVSKTTTEPSTITVVEETSDLILTTDDEMTSTSEYLTADDDVTSIVTSQPMVTSDKTTMHITNVSKTATEPSTITILEETSDPILTTDGMAITLEYLTTDDDVTSVVTSNETTSGKDGMNSTSENITTDDEVTSVATSDETTSAKDGMSSTPEYITTDNEVTSVVSSDETTCGKDGMNSTSEYITTDDEITSSVTSQSMETIDTITIQTTDVVSKTTTEPSTISVVEETSDPILTTDGMTSTSEYVIIDDEVTTVVTFQSMVTSDKTTMHITDVSKTATEPSTITILEETSDPILTTDEIASTLQFLTTDDEVTSVVTSQTIVTSDGISMQTTDVVSKTTNEPSTITVVEETSDPILTTDEIASTLQFLTTDDEVTSDGISMQTTDVVSKSATEPSTITILEETSDPILTTDGMATTLQNLTTNDDVTSIVTSQSMETIDTITIQTADVVSKTTTEPSTTALDETSDSILKTDGTATTLQYLTTDDDVTSFVTSQTIVTSDGISMQTTDVVSKTTTEPSTITILEETSDPILTTDGKASTLQYLTTDDDVTSIVTSQPMETSNTITIETTDVVSKSATEPSTITVVKETSDPILTTDGIASTLQYLTTDDDVTSIVTSQTIVTSDEISMQTTVVVSKTTNEPSTTTILEETSDPILTTDGMASTLQYLTADDEATSVVTSQSMITSDETTIQITDFVSKSASEQLTITGVESSDPNFTTDDIFSTSKYLTTDDKVSMVVSTDNRFLDITTIAPVTPRLTKPYLYGNAFGNVNFKTFDGRNFTIVGSDLFVGCKSRFDDVCLNSEFCNFKLFIQLEKNTDVGMAEIVKLKIELKFVKEALVFEFDTEGNVRLNEVKNILPIIIPEYEVGVWQTGTYIILETNLGLRVRWITHHGCVSVGLTSSWKNKVDGLLGNFNGEPDDDFADNTGKIQTLNQFVKSFVIKQEGTSDGNFANDLTCRNNATMTSAIYRCSILTDKSGPFASCLISAAGPQRNSELYYEKCIADICSVDTYNQEDNLGCGTIASFVSECNMAGIEVTDWRQKSVCRELLCPSNSTYKVSAEVICSNTCASTAVINCASEERAEGCFCDNGYSREGNACVASSQCGCFYKGNYQKLGANFTTRTCDERCVCSSNHTPSCGNISCHNKAFCGLVGGKHDCHCEDGYIGDGTSCRRACHNFECSSPNYGCVTQSQVCNFNCDCDGCEDEAEDMCCNVEKSSKHCSKAGHTRCYSGRYIENSLFCNGKDDCEDGSDEDDKLCSDHCDSFSLKDYNVTLSYSPKKARHAPNSTITFSCLANYVINGNTELKCRKGEWTGAVPDCFAPCGSINVVHGRPSNSENKHGTIVVAICDAGYESDDNNKSVVCDNGEWMDDLATCVDVNECVSNPCANGVCENLENRYECSCSAGWTGRLCTDDIDECELQTDLCGEEETCENTDGSYNCVCAAGYILSDKCGKCVEEILLPFGTSQRDNRLTYFRTWTGYRYFWPEGNSYATADNFVSQTISIPTGFPLGDNFYYSLYIVENGLIIFLRDTPWYYSWYYWYRSSYPYPHSWFLDYLPAVAPFWADAEIALGYSNVYYQVYEKSSDETFIDSVTDKIKTPKKPTTFRATWMLVVTWEKLIRPGGVEANTFQAVLLTDGRYSFALFNYQECEMNWNVQALSYPNVIIGHNSRGSNGYGSTQIQNSLPFSSTLDKFRPDLLTGNTGLKGKWEFRLEDNTETTVNSKQFCLDWYYQEPSPYQWTFRFDPCPPSYWQARRDWRYIRTSRMYDVKYRYQVPDHLTSQIGDDFYEDISREYGEICYQPALSRPWWWWWGGSWWWGWNSWDWWSWSPAKGNICCYNTYTQSLNYGYRSLFQSSLAERYQYNNGWRFDKYRYEKWFEKDFLPRYHCCYKSRDWYFCNLYRNRRPTASTFWYRPPGWGWFFGDPHMRTLDGYDYTFNGLGEYVLVSIEAEDTKKDFFVLQGRTERAINRKTNQTTQATVFNAFAAVFVNATKVQIGLDEMDEEFEIYLDDEWFNATRLKEEETYNHDDNGTFLLRYEKTENSSGITALWDSGISVTVEARLGLLDVVFSAPELYRNGSTRGLLGVWNGDSGDDFLRRDDVQQVPANGVNLTERELYEFGESWRVKKADSLFHTSSRRKRADDESETFKPIFLSDLVEEAKANDTEFYNEVLDTCGSNTECQYDSLATKDAELGASSKVSQEVLQSDQKSINNFPPNITGDDELWAEVGQVANYSFEAVDLDGDEIHVSLIGNVTNATLTDSSVSWIPSSIDIVILAIQASDNQSSSVLEPAVKICDCKNNGSCLWDSYTQTSDIDADKFAVVVCNCTSGWTGDFCEKDLDACEDEPCYPGVSCFDEKPPSENATCGSCPENLVGDGFQCYDADECAAKPEPCEQICDNILGGYACSCRKGYSLSLDDSATCLDEDECELNTHNCDENAFCTNTEGSFQCNCTDGYYGDGFNCTDANECATLSPCHHFANCTNTEGSYICSCMDGFEGNGVDCQNVNECEEDTHDCDTHATCHDNNGGYSCTCNPGWTGSGEMHTCSVSYCENSPCHTFADCIDGDESYVCVCQDGFVGNGYECTFVDACEAGLHDCDMAEYVCVRNQSSYYCQCLEGYEEVNGTCKDVDECNQDVCHPNATCTNFEASYLCECNGGFLGDGFYCNDIDECDFNPCGDDDFCKLGYHTNETGGDCIDVDECALDTNDCQQNCSNTIGGYDCLCERGYKVVTSNPSECEDVDECSSGLDNCEQVCINLNGGYNCSCYEKFFKNGTKCRPLEECDNSTCVNGACYVVQNSTACLCDRGFNTSSADSTVCEDVDECASSELNGCNQICNNKIGSYSCDCNNGYIINPDDNSTCEDINECLVHSSSCNTSNEICRNTIGSFTCDCISGTVRNNSTEDCIDLDECTLDPCGENAVCANTPGSYTCKCRDGYTGDGRVCKDIDECIYPHNCSVNADCINSEGSYNCLCRAGYTGDGKTCSDINECDTPENYKCWANSKCQNTNGSYTCVCENGYSAVGEICMDVDECSLQVTDPNITNCHPDAICSNTDGSYNCNCKDGFAGNGTVCKDIDECDPKGNYPCGPSDTSKCNNTNGSYRCSCHRGYRNVDGCIDIDECRENLHNCDRLATCINKNGSFDCNCSDGYSGNGTHCLDINECSGEHDCHGAATCLNTPGSYTCQCSDGFTSVGERLGRNCADVNECNGTSPLCDGRTELCRNTIGSYQCSCKNGLVKDSSQTCIDIDECLDQNRCTGNNSRCVNTFGSFSCLCKSGYTLDTPGTCIKANFISLQVEFKTIQGLKSGGDLIDRQNLEIYRADMESDIHAVFNGTGGYKSLTISSMKFIPARNHIFIHVNLAVTVGTNYSSLEIVFRQGLDENNVLPPDNVVDPASLYFGELLIDPCADGNHNCTNNAECIFLGQSGHFNCTCRDGWTGDGVAQCIDENECLTSACGSREVCINREGDFLCECNLEQGYARVSEDCIASQVFTTNFSIQEIDGTTAVFNKLLESTVSTEFVALNTTLCKLIFFNTLEGTNYADSYAMCKVRRFKLPNLTAEVALIFERTPSIAPDELENTLNRRLTDHDYILDNGFSNITLRSENITLDGFEGSTTAIPTTTGSTTVDEVTTAVFTTPKMSTEDSSTTQTTVEPECRNNNTCPRNQLCINSECVCDRQTGYVETDEDGCQVSKILKVTFAIVEINSQEAIFNDSLTDRTSNFFMSLQNLVCDLWSITVNNFDGRIWKDDYISCRVLRFFKGSIGADVDLVFDEDSEADSTQMMDAIEVVLQEGDNTLKNSSIGTIKLKNDSIVIDPVSHPECLVDACNEHGNCTVSGKEVICSCDESYTGVSCESTVDPPTVPIVPIVPIVPYDKGIDVWQILVIVFALLIVLLLLALFIVCVVMWRNRRGAANMDSKISRKLSTSSSSSFGTVSPLVFATEATTSQDKISESDLGSIKSEEIERMDHIAQVMGRMSDLNEQMRYEKKSNSPESRQPESLYNRKGPYVADGSEALRKKRRNAPLKVFQLPRPEKKRNEDTSFAWPR